jgi:hypothetical protein
MRITTSQWMFFAAFASAIGHVVSAPTCYSNGYGCSGSSGGLTKTNIALDPDVYKKFQFSTSTQRKGYSTSYHRRAVDSDDPLESWDDSDISLDSHLDQALQKREASPAISWSSTKQSVSQATQQVKNTFSRK